MNSDYFGKPPIDLENNQPFDFGIGNREAYMASNWIIAIDAWDYCDASLLAEMLNRHPIPFELQHVIANIISGNRKQKRKAADKQKVPAGHRMIFAGMYLSLKRDVIDSTLKRKSLYDYHEKAAELGIEVIELQREYQKSAQNFKKEWADSAGISVPALEKMVSALKSKIKRYPDI